MTSQFNKPYFTPTGVFLVNGQTKSGKTFFVSSQINKIQKEQLRKNNNYWHSVVVLCEATGFSDDYGNFPESLKISGNIPENLDKLIQGQTQNCKEYLAQGKTAPPMVIIVDDVQGRLDCSRDGKLASYVTDCRKRQICLIILVQYTTQVAPIIRRNSTTYIFSFYEGAIEEIMKMLPNNSKEKKQMTLEIANHLKKKFNFIRFVGSVEDNESQLSLHNKIN